MNYIEIEKFKVGTDSSGNEVLTQVDAVDGTKTVKKENWLNETMKHNFTLSSSVLNVETTSTNLILGFERYRIGVSTMKILTKIVRDSSSNVTTNEALVKEAFFLGDTPTDSTVTQETGTDVKTVTFKSRFSPPTVEPRVINSLGVFRENGTFTFNNVLLDVPCIQATDEILIVTYRYQYDYKSIKESIPAHEALESLGFSTMEGIVRQIGYFYESQRGYVGAPYYFSFTTAPYTKEDGVGAFPVYGMPYSSYGGNTSVFKNGSYSNSDESFKFLYASAGISDFNGKFISSVNSRPQYNLRIPYNAISDTFNSEVSLRKPLDSVVQNIYTKKLEVNGSVDKPFYDLNAVGDSLGIVTVSDSFDSGDTSYDAIPHLVGLNRIEIVNGGAAQTASYKVSLRYVTGFLGVNSWKMNPSSPCLRAVKDFSSTKQLTTEYTIPVGTIPHNRQITVASLIQPLELGEVLVFLPYETSHPEYGLWVQPLDLRQDYLHLTPTTLPSFGATDIRGFATAEDGTIIVACANTGLWKLKRKRGDSLAATTVTRVSNTGATDDTKCHAVNFVRYNHRFNSDGRIVAVFGSQLCISENGGDTWSVYDENSNPKFTHMGDYSKLLGVNGAMYSEDIVVLNYSNIEPAFEVLGGVSTQNLMGKSVFWYKDRSGAANSFSVERVFYEYTEYLDTRAFWFKGAGNNICLPTLSTTAPFLVLHYQSYLTLRGYDPIGNTVHTLPQLDDAHDYNTQAPVLVDDLVNSTTYMINRVSSSSYNLRFSSVDAWLAGTTNSSEDMAAIHANIPVSVAGRGILLGDLHELEGTRYTSVTGNEVYLESQWYFKNIAHIATGNDDGYKDNRFNFWYEYSFNLISGQWELAKEADTPTAKVTHTISEPMVTGLSIKFADSPDYVGNVLNYVAGEVFDQYVCDGILKDDYTTFEFKTLNFWGDSEEGNTFSNGAVPANPVGTTTERLTVQYSKRWESRNYSTIANTVYFDPAYIGMYGVNSSSNTTDGYAISTLGENLVGDFTLETQLAYTSSESWKTSTSSYGERTRGAMLKLVDSSSISGTAITPTTLLGLRIQRFTGKPAIDTLTLVIEDSVNGFTYVDIESFDPTDVYKITRVGNVYNVLRNDVSIHTVTINATSVRWIFQVAEVDSVGTMSSKGYSSLLLALVNPKITYNSQTLKVKIGDSTLKTGAYAPNFKYMSYIEWLHNVKALYLDGVQANVIYDMETNEPPQGAIRINIGSGELYFNSADAGKLITGDWRTTPTLNSNGE